MNYLYQWATRHHIPPAALQELIGLMTSIPTGPDAPIDARAGSESSNQNLTRIDAARHGCTLWRNNVGALLDEKGRLVRYGLANESKEMNRLIKSSDLIGIRPITITAEHVGSVIGQFVAREEKELGWQYAADPRESAQLAFINFVNAKGGDAKFNSIGRFE